MDRNEAITKLVDYAVQEGLVEKNEFHWAVNTILDVLKLDDYTPVPWDHQQVALAPVLEALLDDAHERGVLAENSVEIGRAHV